MAEKAKPTLPQMPTAPIFSQSTYDYSSKANRLPRCNSMQKYPGGERDMSGPVFTFPHKIRFKSKYNKITLG